MVLVVVRAVRGTVGALTVQLVAAVWVATGVLELDRVACVIL
jgi:hypothetical protein